jgi:hypothetical protein
LAERELLDRVDRKFLAPIAKIPLLLRAIRNDYRVLTAGDQTWAQYETCYFDTERLTSFHEHMRGRRPRFKIRIRHHTARCRSFLEVKHKDAGGRTFKARVESDFGESNLSEAHLRFLRRHVPSSFGHLTPSVWTNFHRATFLGFTSNERLTIDLGLTFIRGGSSVHRDSLAIIELKQPTASHQTASARALRQLRIREASLSKYCAGVAELHEGANARARHTMKLRLEREFR